MNTRRPFAYRPIRNPRLSLAFVLGLAALVTPLAAAVPARAETRPAPPKALVAIPFTHEYGQIILPVGINGSAPMRFLLDTGASDCIVDAAIAKQLRLSFEGRAVVQGAGGSAGIGVLRGVTFNVPHLNLTIDGHVFATDLHTMRTSECDDRPTLDGILGTAFFWNFVVTIDYEAKRIYLFDQKSYAFTGEGSELPLEVSARGLFVRASARLAGDATCEGRYLVDTGFGGAVSLNTPVVKKYDLVTRERPGYDSGVHPIGFGGRIDSRVARIPAFSIGDFELRNVVTMLALEGDGAVASRDFKGIVGNRALSRFRVTFNLRGRRLVLERTRSTDRPFASSASGLRLVAANEQDRGAVVCGFLTGSPAEAAGMRRGDRIAAVNGRGVDDVDVDDIDDLLDAEGAEIIVDVVRGTERLQVRFTPKQPV